MNKPRAWPKLLSIWMHAAADAWNMGEADWLFDSTGRSYLVRVWTAHFEKTKDEMAATEAVVRQAQACGIDPKRHKVSAR